MPTTKNKAKKTIKMIFSEPLLNIFRQRLKNTQRKRSSSEPIALATRRASLKAPVFEVGPPKIQRKMRVHKSISFGGDTGIIERYIEETVGRAKSQSWRRKM